MKKFLALVLTLCMAAGVLPALAETALEETPIFISHGDCLDDAQKLQSILEEEFGRKVNLITGIGSLIGAHSGPGTLALFFLGRQR